MKKIYFDKFQKFYSIKFFILVVLTSALFFSYFDIAIFEFTRQMHGYVFSFFKHIIDPISRVFDPLNVSIILISFLILSNNIKLISRNSKKISLLKDKTGLKESEIFSIFNYYRLIIKHCLVSIIIAGVACNILKYIMGVARPKYLFFENAERFDFFNIVHKMNSFPSGHTQAAFTIAALMLLYINRFSILVILLATLMGISRIFMSMHFPSDIIFGAYLGFIVPIAIYKHFFIAKIKKIENRDYLSLINFLKLLYWRFFL